MESYESLIKSYKQLKSEIRILKTKYYNLRQTMTKLIIKNNRRIMKKDIEEYFSKPNRSYEEKTNSTYSLSGIYCIKEASIQDYELTFKLETMSYSKNVSFIIKIDNLDIPDANITTSDGLGRNVTLEYLLEQEYSPSNKNELEANKKVLEELINNIKRDISLMEKNIDYLNQHNENKDYYYSLSHHKKFYNFNDVIDYIQTKIYK